MNTADLVDKVAEATEMTKAAAGRAVEAVMETIIDALQAGEEVRLTGLGIFDVVNREARPGRNPQTGASIDIPASKALRFRAGKAIKDQLNATGQGTRKKATAQPSPALLLSHPRQLQDVPSRRQTRAHHRRFRWFDPQPANNYNELTDIHHTIK
jgi:DNA-binding protein HU-beta